MEAKQTVQTQKVDVVTFDPAIAVARTPNFFRERKPERKRRVAESLKTPTQFLAFIGEHYARILAQGTPVVVAGNRLTIADPNTLRCEICHGVAGMPNKAEQAAGEGWNPARIALIALFLRNGKVVPISETCTHQYVLPLADQLTNPADLRKAYSLPAKPKS